MTRRRFVLQAAFVVTLAVLVSWPQFASVRAESLWVYTPAAAVERGADALRTSQFRFTEDERGLQTLEGRAQALASTATGVGGAEVENQVARQPFVTPFAAWELGAELNAVVGRARTLQNQPIPFARVVLRNILTGQVIARATANEEGVYQFLDVDASAYIVELLGEDGAVIAASETVSVAIGDVQETTVRAGARASQLLAFQNSQQNTFGPLDDFDETLDETVDDADDEDVTGNDPGTQNPASPGNPLGRR